MPAVAAGLVWKLVKGVQVCVHELAYAWFSWGFVWLSESRACTYFPQKPWLLSELVKCYKLAFEVRHAPLLCTLQSLTHDHGTYMHCKANALFGFFSCTYFGA